MHGVAEVKITLKNQGIVMATVKCDGYCRNGMWSMANILSVKFEMIFNTMAREVIFVSRLIVLASG